MVGKWIWVDDSAYKNSYGEFLQSIQYAGGTCSVKLACDSKYNLYVNGNLVSFGPYPGYPELAFYDEIDITPFLKKGENILAFLVWYTGESTFIYRAGQAGLFYEVTVHGETVACSSELTRSRYSASYDSSYTDAVTPQIGFSTSYIATQENWTEGDITGVPFSESYVCPYQRELKKRPNERLVLHKNLPVAIVQQGEFIYPDKSPLSSQMHQAFLSFRYLHEFTGDLNEKQEFDRAKRFRAEGDNGIYFTVDLLSMETGFVSLDIEVTKECYIDIGFGEHLQDGRVRSSIGPTRNFCMRYKAQAGRQTYLNSMLRVGCRYLQFFVHCNDVTVYYAGLRPTNYPIKEKAYQTNNLLHRAVYETAVRTLKRCMHEHYEDTPWREQSLYVFDGGLQMIYGFSAFEDYGRFARSNLMLMNLGLRKDGLLDITFPSETELTIPFFGYFYPVVVGEYVKETGDLTLVKDTFETVKTILDTALSRLDETGLVLNYDKPYWNYYEWSNYQETYPEYSLILNSMLSLALQSASEYFARVGKDGIAKSYKQSAMQLNEAIRKNLFDEKKGAFRSGIMNGCHTYSELGNSLTILCGAAGESSRRIAENLISGSFEKIGLATRYFKYEALCAVGGYEEYILCDIDKACFTMLREGATTFWETEIGQTDFINAGSLSHAWTSFAVRYYRKFVV